MGFKDLRNHIVVIEHNMTTLDALGYVREGSTTISLCCGRTASPQPVPDSCKAAFPEIIDLNKGGKLSYNIIRECNRISRFHKFDDDRVEISTT